jgi:hypothetical protein
MVVVNEFAAQEWRSLNKCTATKIDHVVCSAASKTTSSRNITVSTKQAPTRARRGRFVNEVVD